MAASSFPLIEVRFFKNNGDPAAGFLLDQFASGTETDQDTYTDFAGTVPNAHPITLDEWGRCVMFGAPGSAYTFRLRDPVTDEAIWSRDNLAPAPATSTTQYVPLDGSVAMTGLLELSGPATGNLNPVTYQQMVDALAEQLSTLTEQVALAQSAAEDAEAAAEAAINTRNFYSFFSDSGGAISRDIYLQVGDWEIVLETNARATNPATSSISATITQSATMDTTTVSTSVALTKNANDTQTTHVTGRARGVLSVATAGVFTLSVAAVSLGTGTTATGSTVSAALLPA